MMEIELPQPRQVGEELLTATDVLDRVLFSQPVWRQRANVTLGLSLIEKTRQGPSKRFHVSAAELEVLEKCCEMPGFEVRPPALSHFFLAVVAAIYAAKPVVEEKPK